MRHLLYAAVAVAAPAIAMAQTAPIVGDWYGTLNAGGNGLPLVFHIKADGSAAVDSPAQNAMGLAATASFAEGRARVTLTAILASFEGVLSADGKTLDGKWSQGGAQLPLALGRTPSLVQAVAPPIRPQTPKPPFPYRAEEVSYLNPVSGLKLAGTLTLPQGEGPFPVALLITGSGVQDRDETIYGHKPFLVLADALTRKGVAVLRVDDRGAGGSQAGDLTAATTADYATDVEAGVAFLRGRKDIDPGRVGLIGHSEGGLIAPMVAARDTKIAFIVLMAGTGVSGGEVLKTQIHDITLASGAPAEKAQQQAKAIATANAIVLEEPDTAKARPRIIAALIDGGAPSRAAAEAQVTLLTSPWYRAFLTLDPAASLSQVRAPVLAVNGEKDTQVSAKQNLPAIKAALIQSPDVTVVALPGLNHLFQTATTGSPGEYGQVEETLAPAALDLIVNWTAERAKLR